MKKKTERNKGKKRQANSNSCESMRSGLDGFYLFI